MAVREGFYAKNIEYRTRLRRVVLSFGFRPPFHRKSIFWGKEKPRGFAEAKFPACPGQFCATHKSSHKIKQHIHRQGLLHQRHRMFIVGHAKRGDKAQENRLFSRCSQIRYLDFGYKYQINNVVAIFGIDFGQKKSPSVFQRLKNKNGRMRKRPPVSIVQKAYMTDTEIAYLTAFNDPSYFTRVFSKEFGGLHENFHK